MSSYENWCKNYNGLINKTCEAGVEYGAVKNPDGQAVMRDLYPCFRNSQCPATCSKQEFPTAEDIAAYNVEIAQYIQRMGTVRKAIVEHIKANGNEKRSISGNIKCPICGDGVVGYSYAGSYNRHIHAQCSNGCVNWME